MKLWNTAKSLLTAGMIALSGAEAKGQGALDQTVNNTTEQLYKIVVFANGDPNSGQALSHNYIGPKNFDVGWSQQGGRVFFWRADTNNPSNTQWFFTRITWDAPTFPPQMSSDTIWWNTITWQDARLWTIYPNTGTDSNGNSLNAMNLNPNLRMEETSARSDTNNDGVFDARRVSFTLPRGQNAINAGFQEGDFAIFSTPELASFESGWTAILDQWSYKKLVRNSDNELIREDTNEFPTAQGLNRPAVIPDWISTSLSTKEVINNSQITVYPNPTTDYISIQLGTGLHKIEGYTLYTSDGRQALTGKPSGTDTKIDVQTLPAGVYFLHLIIDGKQTTQKIIKQ